MEFLNLTSQEHISTKKLTEKLEEFCTQSWEEVSNWKQQLLSLLPLPCALDGREDVSLLFMLC